jgi:uncharacterized FlaG/YvyC family protein
MDVRRTNEPAQASRPDLAAERAAALAEARQRASAERARSAEAASARRAANIAEYRAAIADAVGANTRVAISRAPTAPIFLYQAIDRETGEVVQQWPRLEFIGLSRALAAIDAGPAAGGGVDQQA